MNEAKILKLETARLLLVDEDGRPRWKRSTFQRLAARGEIPVMRISGKFYVSEVALDRWLAGEVEQ